jgi:hypothetical protein
MRMLAALVIGLVAGFAAGIIATSSYYEHTILHQAMLPPAITANGSISPPGSPGSSGGDTVGRDSSSR